MSKFGYGTLKQKAYEYLTDLKNDHEVSQIVLCQEIAVVLGSMIEEISREDSIAEIITQAKKEERNRIKTSL